jgi:roadblock/LC7 domain-containing protein
MLYRRSFEAECPVASLSERCEAYRLAYIQEVQRNSHLVQQNSHLVQAYGALSGQHGIVLHELAALASQYCLLEKELFDAQADAVAYEAVVQEYKLALASQSAVAAGKTSSGTKLLTERVAELERERTDMQRALVVASELVIASRKHTDWTRASASEF